jgi:hypothetical protein
MGAFPLIGAIHRRGHRLRGADGWKNQIVFAKFSSQTLPMDEQRIQLTMQGIAAMRNSVLVAQEA